MVIVLNKRESNDNCEFSNFISFGLKESQTHYGLFAAIFHLVILNIF